MNFNAEFSIFFFYHKLELGDESLRQLNTSITIFFVKVTLLQFNLSQANCALS